MFSTEPPFKVFSESLIEDTTQFTKEEIIYDDEPVTQIVLELNTNSKSNAEVTTDETTVSIENFGQPIVNDEVSHINPIDMQPDSQDAQQIVKNNALPESMPSAKSNNTVEEPTTQATLSAFKKKSTNAAGDFFETTTGQPLEYTTFKLAGKE